jgi:hypothetical protein
MSHADTEQRSPRRWSYLFPGKCSGMPNTPVAGTVRHPLSWEGAPSGGTVAEGPEAPWRALEVSERAGHWTQVLVHVKKGLIGWVDSMAKTPTPDMIYGAPSETAPADKNVKRSEHAEGTTKRGGRERGSPPAYLFCFRGPRYPPRFVFRSLRSRSRKVGGCPATGAHRKREGALPLSRKKAAAKAGLSEHQRKTALRVANVPKAEFEEKVENPNPPTVTELAERGKIAGLPADYLGRSTPQQFSTEPCPLGRPTIGWGHGPRAAGASKSVSLLSFISLHARNAPLRSIAAQSSFTALILAFAWRHIFAPQATTIASAFPPWLTFRRSVGRGRSSFRINRPSLAPLKRNILVIHGHWPKQRGRKSRGYGDARAAS